MACRDQHVAIGIGAAKLRFVATVCLLSILASACSAGALGGVASDAPSALSELIGKEVMISFKWSKPTSVLESLTVVGTLIRAEQVFLVVDVEGRIRNDFQEQLFGALERNGKIKRDPDGHTVYVFRSEIARLRLHPQL
jgi:hypothetical protein